MKRPVLKIMPVVLAVVVLVWIVLASGRAASRDDAIIAVASNFTATARILETAFEDVSGYALTLTSGSTGVLEAQILHGAPFDVLMAADQHSPRRLEAAGRIVAGSTITYARGRLALWSPDPRPVEARLRTGDYRTFAIANPELAPYGHAARQALREMGVWSTVEPRRVTGESIAQVQAMIASGAADIGMVPLSQFTGTHVAVAENVWIVPEELHAPILQDAVLTRHGETNVAALAWLAFLSSPEATTILRRHGYEVTG